MVELRLPQMHRKSVCLCELWQEGEAYGKTGFPRPYASALSSHLTDISPPARNARRSLMTERSERMSEEASFHPHVHFPLSLLRLILQYFHEALTLIHHCTNIPSKPVYTA